MTVIRLLFGLRFIRITVLFVPGIPDTVLFGLRFLIRCRTFVSQVTSGYYSDSLFIIRITVFIRKPVFIRSGPAGDGYPVIIRITVYLEIIRITVIRNHGYSYYGYSYYGSLFGNRFTVFQP